MNTLLAIKVMVALALGCASCIGALMAMLAEQRSTRIAWAISAPLCFGGALIMAALATKQCPALF